MKSPSVNLLLSIVLILSCGVASASDTDNSVARLESERILKSLDKNADGTISPDEATGVVKKHFARIDGDSNRKITLDELTTTIHARNQRVGRPASSDSQDKKTGFQRPQAGHRTSRPVPMPWLGHGHDDHPDIRGATYLKTPEEIRELVGDGKNPLSYPKGSGLRIVATGHSWMRPGFGTLPKIAQAAGLEQHLRLNTRGGESGGARMMWELENGILSSHGRANPVCMAAITTGEWDAMMWGSYTNDRPDYYFGWIDFCTKFNPKMEFYVFNGWPQWADGFGEGDREPRIENYRARAEIIDRSVTKKIADLDKRYPNKVHVLPTCEAMLAVLELYFEGKLPGVQGLNRQFDGKSPSIWSDGGHLDAGMDRLEGYVFYATLYQKSPELIETTLPFHNDELDKIFRKIAWQAVVNNPLSDVTDKNNNGIGDAME